jgi:hypothetical protein
MHSFINRVDRLRMESVADEKHIKSLHCSRQSKKGRNKEIKKERKMNERNSEFKWVVFLHLLLLVIERQDSLKESRNHSGNSSLVLQCPQAIRRKSQRPNPCPHISRRTIHCRPHGPAINCVVDTVTFNDKTHMSDTRIVGMTELPKTAAIRRYT